jgi:undecaprenyl-diphosphatase
MSEVLVPGSLPADSAAGADDRRPPGDRYFRHPGDVVRLVLWGGATLLLAGFLAVATSTSQGVTTDLGRAATRVPDSVRELVLGLVQAGAVLLPLGAVIALVIRGRWRRLALLVGSGAAGAAVFALVDATSTLHRPIAGAVTGDTWLMSSDVPPLGYVAGAVAAATMGKPWLSRAWRRSLDVAVVVLAAAMAFAGTAGVPELALAIASGAAAGAALLVVFGAPNRRPSPAAVRTSLRDAGVDVGALTLEAAPEGRAQRYSATTSDGEALFLKVYAQDARDADLLYRGYRSLLLRGPTDERPLASLAEDVEHQALLVMLAGRARAPTPELRALARLPDGSAALALERVAGRRLDEVPADELDDAVLEAVWRGVGELHRARLAHRALRAGNILVAEGRPTIVDLSFAEESADPRLLAIDRAELLASLAALVGAERAVDAAARVLDPDDLAAALAYLQPLALSAATRRATSKSLLVEVRDRVAEVTGAEVPPLERLVRVQPRAVLTVVVLAGAFYLLLPQLADVNDSVRALRSAQWGWLGVCVVMSALTYPASAVGLAGGVPNRLPLVPTTLAAMASSFVNRVTPANVGGMALNVRFMQKAGVESGAAVTGMGLNVVAGGIVHGVLLVVFFSWARQKTDGAFAIPSSSRLLVGIAVVLALVGIALAVPKTRGLFTKHVGRLVRQSWTSLRQVARSPLAMAALFGGSFGVTLAYIGALSAAVVALGGDLTFAQVGAVYLGSSLIASAAPTPGGLGAMEAALVAGFTGVGLESGVAVAAVLSYRLATYWLPILPGWFSFHLLERRNQI